jgi:hypothetical protein
MQVARDFPDALALHTMHPCTKTLPEIRFGRCGNKHTYPMWELLHINN